MARERQAEEVPSENTYLVCLLRDDTVEAIRVESYKSRGKKTLAQERKAARLRKREIEKRDPKELKRLREAGVLLPDSGISCVDDFKGFNEFGKAYGDPLLYTQYVRRAFYCQLNKEQMQRAVAQYYGWEKWSEDPWGSYPKFCEWVTNARDNEMAVWAVNETSVGRDYLFHCILEGLGQLGYSEMTDEDILAQIGYGGACFLYVKSYTGWDNFLNHYPKEPLPARLVNEWVSKVYPFDFKLTGSISTSDLKPDGSFYIPRRVPDPEEIIDFINDFIDARKNGPLTRYRSLISGIYLWYIALDISGEKGKEYPELEAFLNYLTATDALTAELCQKLSPKDYRLPDENRAWEKLDQALRKPLDAKERKHRYVLEMGYASTWEGLLTGVSVWKSKAHEAILAGLKGQLRNSLLYIVENYFISAKREADPAFARLWQKAQEIYKPKTKIERNNLLEMVKNLRDKIQWKELLNPSDKELFKSLQEGTLREENISASVPLSLDREFETEDGDNYSLGDMITDKQAQGFVENIKEPVDLKSLRIDIDKLPPEQKAAFMRVYQFLQDGGDLSSKKGESLKQELGKDYETIKRNFSRAKNKLREP